VQNERAVLPCEPPEVLGDGDLRLRSLTGDDWTLEHQMSPYLLRRYGRSGTRALHEIRTRQNCVAD